MFDSDFADFFSRTPWYTVLIIWVPVVVSLFAFSVFAIAVPWAHLALQIVAGVTVWSLTEYWLHRTVFHWEPDNAIGKRFHFIIHGCHHTWIDDKYRLVMPPLVAITLASLFYQLFSWIGVLLTPWCDPSWVYAFFAAFMAGYINYDITHYATHHVKLKNKRLIQIRAHHMNHHFNNPDKKFGFTTLLWDRLFGTL